MHFQFRLRKGSTSSSGGGSQDAETLRQSSTEDLAQELFHNIEQLTMQAKGAAAESLGDFGGSLTSAMAKKREFFKALGESVAR